MRNVLMVAVLAGVLGGCKGIFGIGVDVPDEIRVELDGTATVPVYVMVSKDFQRIYNDATGTTVVEVFTLDTVATSIPFDATYPVRPEKRFWVKVDNPDSLVTVTFQFRVYLDGKLDVAREAALTNGSVEYSKAF